MFAKVGRTWGGGKLKQEVCISVIFHYKQLSEEEGKAVQW